MGSSVSLPLAERSSVQLTGKGGVCAADTEQYATCGLDGSNYQPVSFSAVEHTRSGSIRMDRLAL